MDKFELVRFTDEDFELDVRTDSENETVWLTVEEIALLFSVDRTRIIRHIANIIKDNELDKASTCAESAQVQKEGNRLSDILPPLKEVRASCSMTLMSQA